MYRHEHEVPGRDVRPPRRWHGPQVPPPRVRDRAGSRRPRQSPGQLLVALQHADSKRTEDEQVARQLVPATSAVYGRPPDAGAWLRPDDGAVLYAAVTLLQHPGLLERSP